MSTTQQQRRDEAFLRMLVEEGIAETYAYTRDQKLIVRFPHAGPFGYAYRRAFFDAKKRWHSAFHTNHTTLVAAIRCVLSNELTSIDSLTRLALLSRVRSFASNWTRLGSTDLRPGGFIK